MKLKVLDVKNAPMNLARRIMISRDDGWHEWIRDVTSNIFLLWSRSDCLRSDADAECPFEEIPDGDGVGTCRWRQKPGLLVFSGDITRHSGISYSLSGTGHGDEWDTTRGAFYLYADRVRWEEYRGNCEWTWHGDSPSDELLRNAREAACSEIRMMNMAEGGYYHTAEIQYRCTPVPAWEGARIARRTIWIPEMDGSIGPDLTESPARDLPLPLGIPVVSEDPYVVGTAFDQEVFAAADDIGRFFAFDGDGHHGESCLTHDVEQAILLEREPMRDSLARFKALAGAPLHVVDVTEQVWVRHPEFIA